jgi:hypothetical protein
MDILELLGMIDNLNTEGKLDYGDYSELHDSVSIFAASLEETIAYQKKTMKVYYDKLQTLRASKETL